MKEVTEKHAEVHSPHFSRKNALKVGGAIVALAVGGAIFYGAHDHHHHNRTATSPETSASKEINLIRDGQFAYLPGATLKANGLYIAHRGFAIVEQDGSGGQPNALVNEYGTHFETSGNFAINTTLQDIHGEAALQLYAEPPIVSDEFRVEPPSIRMTVSDDHLDVQLWDGKATQDLAGQQPVEQQSFPFAAAKTIQLSMRDNTGKFTFKVNGKNVGTLPDKAVLSSGQIWLGADAESSGGNFVISDLTIGGKIRPVDASKSPKITQDPNGLQALASKKRPGFSIGGDVALWALASNQKYRQELLGNVGIVTPENAMKWQFTEPQPGVFDFHESDAIVNEALKSGVKVHGHNLVFSEGLPKWVQDLPTTTPTQKAYVKKILVDHVTTLVKHFKGRVNEWDINEIFADYDDNDNLPNSGFTDNVFYRALGPGYVKIVAAAAEAANPKVKLWVNDFGAETDTDARWQFIYNTLKNWKAAGVPIYGFGFESHIYDPTTDDVANDIADNDRPTLDNHINDFAAIGLKSRISEMDAPLSDPGYAEDDSSQAQQFAGVLSICINNPNCVAFSMWSLGPTDVWQNDSRTLQSDSVDSPFDQAMQHTAAYAAMQQVLKN